jgi:CheY-like chemotaxis protein
MARILLVDDNASFRAAARKILTHAGHEVVEAGDGVEALTRYRTAPVDLVITDVYMPEGDGIETTIRLIQEFPDVRLVVMSGGGFVDRASILEIGKRLGAGGTLPKPFSKEQLLTVVDAALGPPSP